MSTIAKSWEECYVHNVEESSFACFCQMAFSCILAPIHHKASCIWLCKQAQWNQKEKTKRVWKFVPHRDNAMVWRCYMILQTRSVKSKVKIDCSSSILQGLYIEASNSSDLLLTIILSLVFHYFSWLASCSHRRGKHPHTDIEREMHWLNECVVTYNKLLYFTINWEREKEKIWK